MRSGEKIIDLLDSVEDTKGNNGDRGIDIGWCYHQYSCHRCCFFQGIIKQS